VSAADLRTVVAAARVHAVVVIPDTRGSGTNALGLSPPTAIVPRFGTNSRYCHEAAARERGLTTTTLLLSSLASDVDEPADLARLVTQQPDRYGFLPHLQRTA
jgi:2-phospho-L-lactate guanylyltransferase (CobY/MobA/RfbA family)